MNDAFIDACDRTIKRHSEALSKLDAEFYKNLENLKERIYNNATEHEIFISAFGVSELYQLRQKYRAEIDKHQRLKDGFIKADGG